MEFHTISRLSAEEAHSAFANRTNYLAGIFGKAILSLRSAFIRQADFDLRRLKDVVHFIGNASGTDPVVAR
jgi:hypothetical protein